MTSGRNKETIQSLKKKNKNTDASTTLSRNKQMNNEADIEDMEIN